MRDVHYAHLIPARFAVPRHRSALLVAVGVPDPTPERVLRRPHVERGGALHEGELEEPLLLDEVEDDGEALVRNGSTRPIPSIIELGFSGLIERLEDILTISSSSTALPRARRRRTP